MLDDCKYNINVIIKGQTPVNISDRLIDFFFITDTNYLYVYVTDNQYLFSVIK